jgi:hypothetical protein
MLQYSIQAITTKNIAQFKYGLYSAMSVNMLKYNHDSSAMIRLLSCFTDTSNEVLEDLNYQFRLNLKALEFINIDRLCGYLISSIPNFSLDNPEDRLLSGYSRYTDKW